MRALLALAVLSPLGLALSGCAEQGGGGDGPVSPEAGPEGEAHEGPGGEGQAPEAQPAEGPRVETYEGSWTAGVHVVGAPPAYANGPAPMQLELRGDEAGVLVEMAWSPSSPLSEAMAVDVLLDGEPVGDSPAGDSPLRLVLPALKGTYTLNPRPAGPDDLAGAFVDQAYTLKVAVFPVAVDGAYAFA